MEQEFIDFIERIKYMNHDQISMIKRALNRLDEGKIVHEAIESRQDQRTCPHCKSHLVYKHGFSANGSQRYRCQSCKATFNARTGTPIARMRKKEKWLDYLDCMNASFSLRKCAQMLNINLKTAFRWRHKFTSGFNNVNDTHLEGIIESDETFFRMSNKGNKRLIREPHKRGNGYNGKGIDFDDVCVLTVCDRSDHSVEHIAGFGPLNGYNAERLLAGIIAQDSIMVSDGQPSYTSFTKRHKIAHVVVKNKAGLRVKNGCYHIQHINNYHMQLKGWINHIFFGVATKYLTHYLNWFHVLNRQKFDPEEMLDYIMNKSA